MPTFFIPEPPPWYSELSVTKALESALVQHGFAVALGDRLRNDARKSMLRVDYTYPDAQPHPVAIEVSGLVDAGLTEGMQARWKLARELSEVARAERLGRWLISVEFTGRNRALRAELLALMRAGVSLETWREPVPGETHPLYTPGLRQRLISLGIRTLEPAPNDGFSDLEVEVVCEDTYRPRGFAGELDQIVEDNREKLGEARPNRTHLAVPVIDWRASDRASDTPPPRLPSEIDVLWVLHRIDNEGAAHGWWTSGSTDGIPDTDWREIINGDFGAAAG